MKYQLVHIPKTGGSALFDFLKSSFPDVFEHTGPGHRFVMNGCPNPITIVRHPLSRMSSIYQFWAKGSEMFGDGRERFASLSDFLDNMDELIKTKYTAKIHAMPQSSWLHEEYYSKCIVIQYQDDLNSSAIELLDYLGIDRGNMGEVPKKNVTKNRAEMKFSQKELKKILNIYIKDFSLWHNVHFHPEKFRKVI